MTNKASILAVDAQTFLAMPIVDTSVALEVFDIAESTAADVKKKLEKLYGSEEFFEFSTDGTTARAAAQADFDKRRYNVADALRVTAMLTREDGGCPWDRAQTHESIRVNMIEEAYEAADAIDKRDVENMREEFGDVLLQSLLQSDISRRAGEFDFDDVCDELSKKLISRHSWIFAGDRAENADEALVAWEKNKGKEKHYDGVKDQLERLPDAFPSLLLVQKTHKKLKKAGAETDPKKDLEKALADKDRCAALYALAALLSDEGKDAEVELNKFVKAKIKAL